MGRRSLHRGFAARMVLTWHQASHAKELSSRMTQVSGLEAIVKELNISKQHQFATLEARQSEVETARAEMERMQNSTKELEYQLRETTERCSLLEDQVNARSGTDGARRGRLDVASRGGTPSPSPSRQNSGVDVQRLLAEAEQRSEAKISDLRFKIRSLENERNDAEEEWALKLQERVRELEKLRRAVTEKEGEYADALRESKDKDGRAVEAEERYKGLERELAGLKAKMLAAEGDTAASADAEVRGPPYQFNFTPCRGQALTSTAYPAGRDQWTPIADLGAQHPT